MTNYMQIEIGEYYLVEDFESHSGFRPVKIVGLVKDKENTFWGKYSDGSIYDFVADELKPI